jgi:putative hemolysin
MLADLSLIFALVVLNGLFAMSEIAIVSARRVRLQQMAEQGSTGAAVAMQLGAEPTRFLSTVQVGITSIGIMSGAVGEATISARLRTAFETVPALAPHADTLAFVVMVAGLTYVSLIAGELVPKRFALTRPEGIATVIARPMRLLSSIVHPLVWLLSASTDAVLRIFRLRPVEQPAVTLDEFRVLVHQGAKEGVLEKTEQELVTNVLRLDERPAAAIMTPRTDIVCVDTRMSFEANRERLIAHPHNVVPLCDGGLDRVIGVVKSADILVALLRGEAPDFRRLAAAPLFVPETTTIMKVLERFRDAHLPMALVIDEHGAVAGVITFADVTAAIVGGFPPEPGEEPMIVPRHDGSWLIDGTLGIEQVRRLLDNDTFARDAGEHFHTVAGLAMLVLGRIPRTGDRFEKDGAQFEIVDMDGNRVDRILLTAAAVPPDVRNG